jgi:hypothetical protein
VLIAGSGETDSGAPLSDVHEAIDVIGEVFSRYYPLFTAASMVILEHVIQHDWLPKTSLATQDVVAISHP